MRVCLTKGAGATVSDAPIDVSEQRDAMARAGIDHFLGPHAGLHLAHVGASQEEHAQSGLPKAAAHT